VFPGNPLRRDRPAYEAYNHRYTHQTESGVVHCGSHVGVTLHRVSCGSLRRGLISKIIPVFSHDMQQKLVGAAGAMERKKLEDRSQESGDGRLRQKAY
jgi:hypothetical protein